MKQFLIFSLLCISTFSVGQNEYDLWYFGDFVCIDFSSGEPILDESQFNPNFNSNESCAVQCDPATGELLFYTDGKSAFRSNHQMMPNGSGLLGDDNASQGVLIVPRPGTNNQFYIFTTDAGNTQQGLRYSLVDMDISSGLGDIPNGEKNHELYTPVIEGLTATKKANGVDYWVITHERGSDFFLAFSVTADGISHNPVKTKIGGPRNSSDSFVSYIKMSPDGSMLATTWYRGNVVELFEFDNATGILSHQVSLPSHIKDWGISFSPDNHTLYIATAKDPPSTSNPNQIHRYDLTDYIDGFDNVPEQLVITTDTDIGGLQIGPDGRIYVAIYNENKLGIITCPNDFDRGCGYEEHGFLLGNRNSRWCPPNLIDDIFNEPQVPPFDIEVTTVHSCKDGNDGSIIIEPVNGVPPFQYFIDNSPISDNIAQGLAIGSYEIVGKDARGCRSILDIEINEGAPPMIIDATSTPESCDEDNGTITVNAIGGTGQLWYGVSNPPASASNTLNSLSSGNYIVYVGDDNNCLDSIEVEIETTEPLVIEEVELISSECGEPTAMVIIEANGGFGGLSYSVNDEEYYSSNTILNLSNQNYVIYVQDEAGCTVSEPINIVGPSPLIIESILSTPATCGEEGGSLSFNVSGGTGVICISLSGNTSTPCGNQILGLLPGSQHIEIEDELGCKLDTTVHVLQSKCPVYVPNAFSPNGDGINEDFRIFTVEGIEAQIVLFMVFDRWGEHIYEAYDFSIHSSSQWWDGTFKGEGMSPGVYAYYIEIRFENGDTETFEGGISLIK